MVRTDAVQGAIALGLLWLGLAMVVNDAGALVLPWTQFLHRKIPRTTR